MDKKLIGGAIALAVLSFGGGAYCGRCHLYSHSLPHIASAYMRAAGSGHSGAQIVAGVICAEELGCSYNPDQAHAYWQQAAEQNMPSAQYLAGYSYENGLGTERDYIKASQLYEQAAAVNHSLAQRQLGYMYFYGKGVTEDRAKGKQLLQKAADSGDVQAKSFLNELYNPKQK